MKLGLRGGSVLKVPSSIVTGFETAGMSADLCRLKRDYSEKHCVDVDIKFLIC